MTTHFILLELNNFIHVRNLKSVILSNLMYINKDKCLDNNMNWFCDTFPHITLLAKLPEVSNNEVFRKLKYSNEEIWKKFLNKCRKEGLTFPQLIIDTFDNEDSKVLKINCKNCNLYNELNEIHSHLKTKLANEDPHEIYEPHITLTFLNKNTPDTIIEELKSKLITVLPKEFSVEGIALSNGNRQIDKIKFNETFPGF